MKKTILVIEDDVIFSRSICNWLSKNDMITKSVTMLSAARKHLATKEFDLILADLRLPDGNSTELLRWMHEKNLAVPFLIMTNFRQLRQELERADFSSVVPDFRLNRAFDDLRALPQPLKDKTEFLCNECCSFGCRERRACYEAVSRKNLGEPAEHICTAPGASAGYRFSSAMENPGFLSVGAIRNVYLPMGFSNFKLEGRGLGSAMLLEFLLYYLTKPEYRLRVREAIYLDAMLDLF